MTRKTPDPALAPMAWFFGASQPGAAPFSMTMTAGADNASAGLMEFFANRIAKDIQAQQAFFACTSIVDLQRTQTTWLQEAVHDYAVEMPRALAACLPFAKPSSDGAQDDGLSDAHADEHMGV